MKSRLTDLTQPQREKVMELRGRGAPWAEIARYVTTKVGKVEQEAVRRFFKDGLPPVEQPGEIQRLEDEVRRARSAEREAIDRAVEAERLREIFNAAKSITPTIPEWTIERSKAKDVPHVPVLFMSDAHFGEVIAADNMDGLNEYNLSIAEERYRRLISKTIELSFDSAIEVITPQLEKIQFTNSGGALLSRPDKLRAHRRGGYSDVDMVFNGKTVSISSKGLNGYAQFDGPPGVDQLLHALRAGHGVAMPGADLLQTNAYELLAADILEAKYIGRGIIDGRGR